MGRRTVACLMCLFKLTKPDEMWRLTMDARTWPVYGSETSGYFSIALSWASMLLQLSGALKTCPLKAARVSAWYMGSCIMCRGRLLPPRRFSRLTVNNVMPVQYGVDTVFSIHATPAL